MGKSGPGTTWNLIEKKLLIGPHLVTLNNLFSLEHYHLYVKSGYARAYVEQASDLPFWLNLYDKMQVARIGVSKRIQFNKLLASFASKGFNSDYPIPVGINYQLLDGSHRIAASFAFKKSPVVELYANYSHSYNRDWFQSVGFTDRDLKIVDSIRSEIKKDAARGNNLSVGIVWGPALKYWDEIFSMFDNGYLDTAFCVELGAPVEVKAFVMMAYQGDGMPKERIINKGIQLAGLSTKIGIFALRDMSFELVCNLKQNIRRSISVKMKDYFFDNIIHVINCPKTAQLILSKYSNI